MSLISEDTVPVLARHYRFQFEPAQQAYVLLYPEGMVRLGASAGEIMKRVNGSATVSSIIADLQAAYPGVDLKADVIEFLEHAYGKGWIHAKQS